MAKTKKGGAQKAFKIYKSKVAICLGILSLAIIAALVVGSIALHKELAAPTPFTRVDQFIDVGTFVTTFYANSTSSSASFKTDVNITYQIENEVITLKIPSFSIATSFDANDTVPAITSKALPKLLANSGLEASSSELIDLTDYGENLICSIGILGITQYITMGKLNNVAFNANATSVGLGCIPTGYKTIKYMRLYLADDVFA